VVLELLERVSLGGPVGVAQLCPPGNAGLDAMPLNIIWDLLGKIRDELGSLRPWPYEAHFTPEHVNQLRQLIDTQLASEAPDTRYPGVVLLRPACLTGCFRVRTHAAKLQQLE